MTRELSLQPRLALLASLVPQGAVLADVGTDHGYIPVCLRQRGVIDRAIASDIGREPLEHARRTAEEYGVGGIDLRLCAGLDAIAPEECDTVLIAGMGGETIWGILAAALRDLLVEHGVECLLLGGQISRSFAHMEAALRDGLRDVAGLTRIAPAEHIGEAAFYGLLAQADGSC